MDFNIIKNNQPVADVLSQSAADVTPANVAGNDALSSTVTGTISQKVNEYSTTIGTFFTDKAYSAKHFIGNATENAGYAYGNTSKFLSDTKANVTRDLNETFNNYAGNGTLIGDAYTSTSDFITRNQTSIKYLMAASGGIMAINSTMNILQGKKNIQVSNEYAKIFAGTSIVALSICASTADEMSGIGNVALGAGLVTALVKTATLVKETIHTTVHLHTFRLKSKEASPELQNVVLLSTQS
ncbi:MAG TPA: hypothetical protein VGP47_06650 [Parachlamydiaceae bacterium]|nr:hypothetical protein [Parachlamydiaceae bacterium]